ncbi:unnamed protein product [Cyprideis torosa]|uniref:Uncharacterized protein n=1 Tax=Cyprideis torosa TaxID=163714 RepID=A0A7R8ZM69_9CRUS|nr:unnamed protein product [Cyprideis torosa]CAG0894865.1 unnamed protein product [Cyprideis torosa]
MTPETKDILIEVTSSSSLNVCKTVCDQLLSEMAVLFIDEGATIKGGGGGDPGSSSGPASLVVEQVKVTDLEGNMRNVYPSRIDLRDLKGISVVLASRGLKLSFVPSDAGFFLQHPRADEDKGPKVLSVDRFTVRYPTQQTTLKADYGPFSTTQTVPAKWVLLTEDEVWGNGTVHTLNPPFMSEVASSALEISAHLVTPVVYRDIPTLRVLFHAGPGVLSSLDQDHTKSLDLICVSVTASPLFTPATGETLRVLFHAGPGVLSSLDQDHTKSLDLICVSVTASPLFTPATGEVKGGCQPDPSTGTCLAEVAFPASWWPPYLSKSSGKHPRVRVQYSVYEVGDSGTCDGSQLRVILQPSTTVADIGLKDFLGDWAEVSEDGITKILLPQKPLYPRSKFHLPVLVHLNPRSPVKAITFRVIEALLRAKLDEERVRARTGLQILGAEGTNTKLWTVKAVNQGFWWQIDARLKPTNLPVEVDPRFLFGELTHFVGITIASTEESWNRLRSKSRSSTLRRIAAKEDRPTPSPGHISGGRYSTYEYSLHEKGNPFQIELYTKLTLAKVWKIILKEKEISRAKISRSEA